MQLGNARMRIVVLLVLLGAALTVRPANAHAAWPIEGGARVALGFGSSYGAAGDLHTHSGVDVAGEPGATVASPVAGTVTFAGRIPGPDGLTVLAVTLESAQGACTLLPLESADVAKGSSIAEGATLGSLAEKGDRSTAGAHVHVSLRKGGLYVDPTPLFGAVAPAGEPDAETSGAAAAAGSATAAAACAHAGVGAASPAPSPATGATTARPQMRPAIPGAVIAPGVTVPSAQAAPAPPAPAALSPAPAAAPVAARAGTPLAVLALRVAARSSKAAITGAIGVLLGVGALWPLWRRDRRKGTGEVCVSAVGEDVATAAGR